ncbi:MAG: SDR family NAD(P)-dependent oxidoreductase [Candidatus Hydrogenedentes bacterium]|nr:SDR family NAD(P)-dependent oxidoreductase [Candidatus Hydrogenedentota bacterium]
MTDLKGKVAVVTGGASGIGRALAERFAEEGMRIVIADVEQSALERAEAEMTSDGAEVIAIRCDVSKAHDVKMLAEETLKAFDSVHVLCNNAGVGITGQTWAIPLEDWEWVLGVNLWGVIHGLHYFVPLMLEHGQPSHIVNTASMAGLTSGGNMAPYHVSKHGVVTLSEGLHHEFRQANANINVSVLCPGWVDTKINDSDRNRPAGRVSPEDLDPAAKNFRDMVSRSLRGGLSPKEVAEMVLKAIVDETFYVLPHAHWKNMIHSRLDDIIEQRDPSIVLPPEM